MKKFIARFKSLPLKTRQLLILGTTLALVVALPLFIWAILTQRFELRKRAATGEPTPSPIPKNPISANTPQVSLQADNFYIIANGKTFYANSSTWPISVHSDPGTSTYTTLEMDWQEHGVPMRLYMYFRSDGTDWWAYEIRTYNGQPLGPNQPNDIYYRGEVFRTRLGQEFTGNIELRTSPNDPYQGVIHFDNLRLQAFTNLVTPIPTPGIYYQNLRFKLKFAGVDDDSADGAKIRIRFLRRASGFDRQTPPVEVTHVGDGVYEAVVSLVGSSPQIPVNDGYTIFIKGEKHLARRFCFYGQNTRCTGNGFFYIGATSIPSTPQTFTFTGLPLEPGDLPPQDGKADSADFAKITSLFTKLCSALTEEEKKTADLDYNGCVNIRDAFLMRKTLEVKFDEY